MADKPTYAANPRVIDVATVLTANTNRDGSGIIVSIASGSDNGFRITSIVAQAVVTTTAGMIRIFLSTDSGITWNLFDEIPIGATSASATRPAHRGMKNYNDLVLKGTAVQIGASTHNAEAHRVWVLGADL